LPAELKSQRPDDVWPGQPRADVERVLVYMPGLPHNSARADFAGDANEIKLAPHLLTGQVDTILVVKARGLNDQAYRLVEDGRTVDAGQRRIASALLRVVRRRLNELADGPRRRRVFSLLGYSEGFAQAAS